MCSDQVILASDTVYPGKPLSDAQAFFAMVAKLLVSSIHCQHRVNPMACIAALSSVRSYLLWKFTRGGTVGAFPLHFQLLFCPKLVAMLLGSLIGSTPRNVWIETFKTCLFHFPGPCGRRALSSIHTKAAIHRHREHASLRLPSRVDRRGIAERR